MNVSTGPELQTKTASRHVGPNGVLIVLVGAAGLVGTWAGTQYFAHRLGYHANLGPAIYRAPSQLQVLCVVMAWACFLGAMIVLLRPRMRRFALALVLVAVALYVVRLGPVYGPFQFFSWARAYRAVPELAAPIREAVRVAGATALVCMFGALALAGSRKRRTASSSYGSTLG